jgi:hypothetical protein
VRQACHGLLWKFVLRLRTGLRALRSDANQLMWRATTYGMALVTPFDKERREESRKQRLNSEPSLACQTPLSIMNARKN